VGPGVQQILLKHRYTITYTGCTSWPAISQNWIASVLWTRGSTWCGKKGIKPNLSSKILWKQRENSQILNKIVGATTEEFQNLGSKGFRYFDFGVRYRNYESRFKMYSETLDLDFQKAIGNFQLACIPRRQKKIQLTSNWQLINSKNRDLQTFKLRGSKAFGHKNGINL
jgi:hypothetical protein